MVVMAERETGISLVEYGEARGLSIAPKRRAFKLASVVMEIEGRLRRRNPLRTWWRQRISAQKTCEISVFWYLSYVVEHADKVDIYNVFGTRLPLHSVSALFLAKFYTFIFPLFLFREKKERGDEW